MQSWTSGGGRYFRREAPRTRQLRTALSRGRCSDGNHRIEVADGWGHRPGYPDMTLCASCDLMLACTVQDKPQTPPIYNAQFPPSPQTADNTPLPDDIRDCQRKSQRIRFFYHDTCCLEIDIEVHMITDHGTSGWSVTTGRAISWYLDALVDCGYVALNQRDRIRTLIRKNGQGRYVENAPWYPTR